MWHRANQSNSSMSLGYSVTDCLFRIVTRIICEQVFEFCCKTYRCKQYHTGNGPWFLDTLFVNEKSANTVYWAIVIQIGKKLPIRLYCYMLFDRILTLSRTTLRMSLQSQLNNATPIKHVILSHIQNHTC